MKFFFPMSEWSIQDKPKCWLQHLAICLNSLKANTILEPVVIWRGRTDHPLVDWLVRNVSTVLFTAHPFDAIMTAPDFKPQRHLEVSFATLMKLEASFWIHDPYVIVGDVDSLWLRQPEEIEPVFIAAGPRMHRDSNGMNAGMTVINREAMMDTGMFHRASEIIQKTNTGSDEVILNELFRDKVEPLPWEQRAFWSMPPRTPACVHFHGPKLYQIDALSRIESEALNSATYCAPIIQSMFSLSRSELTAWAAVARPYLMEPLPLYEELQKLRSSI